MTADLRERAAKIKLLVLDVDGVLTDGSIVYTDAGAEIKSFHVRDGSAIKIWREAGGTVAILSGRRSAAVDRRALELGISVVVQGASEKLAAFERILNETGFRAEQACAVGDDLPDLPVLMCCGLGVAVADACLEVREAAQYVTAAPGGRGAVREVVEWLLRGRGQWAGVVDRFREPPIA